MSTIKSSPDACTLCSFPKSSSCHHSPSPVAPRRRPPHRRISSANAIAHRSMAEHFLSSLAADLTGFDCWFLWILLWNTIAYTLSLQFSLLASSLKSKTAEAAAVYYDSSHVYEYTAVTVSDDGVFEEVLLFILSNAVGTLIWLGRGRNRTRVEGMLCRALSYYSSRACCGWGWGYMKANRCLL